MLAGWIGTDNEEVVRGGDAAMACTGGEDGDISGANGHGCSLLSPKHDLRVAGGESQNFVRSGVIVVEVEDAVTPLRRPAVLCEEAFHDVG
jgi:hypothetical protein